jgi:hypothetical protein
VTVNGHEVGTKVVRASELEDVVWKIHKLRNPSLEEDFKLELAEYQRQRGRRKEVEAEQTDGPFKRTIRGFYKLVDGEPEFHQRPVLKRPRTWMYAGMTGRSALRPTPVSSAFSPIRSLTVTSGRSEWRSTRAK